MLKLNLIFKLNKLPDFLISYGDNNYSQVFYHGLPRPFFLDILTKPGVLYGQLAISISTPQTEDSFPAGKICSVEMVYVGQFVTCVEPVTQFFQG